MMNLQTWTESVKEILERWTSRVNLPSKEERTLLMNQKILSQLQEIGVAAQDEVHQLKKRIQRLESLLAQQEQNQLQSESSVSQKKKNKGNDLDH